MVPPRRSEGEEDFERLAKFPFVVALGLGF